MITCWRNYVILTCFILLSIASLILVSNLSSGEPKLMDWSQFQEIWEKYIFHPSDENAKKVINILPDKDHVVYSHSEEEAKALKIVSGEGLRILEYEVHSSELEAVRSAFRLFTIADGAFAEELCFILGSLIRINPKLFLEELKNHEHLIRTFRLLLFGNFDVYYEVDPFYELEKRKISTKFG